MTSGPAARRRAAGCRAARAGGAGGTGSSGPSTLHRRSSGPGGARPRGQETKPSATTRRGNGSGSRQAPGTRRSRVDARRASWCGGTSRGDCSSGAARAELARRGVPRAGLRTWWARRRSSAARVRPVVSAGPPLGAAPDRTRRRPRAHRGSRRSPISLAVACRRRSAPCHPLVWVRASSRRSIAAVN